MKFSHLLEFVRGCSYLDKKLWPKKYYPHLGSKIAYSYSSVLEQKMHFSRFEASNWGKIHGLEF